MKIYIVSWGYYFLPDAEYSYSYWDLSNAKETFKTYQAMVPDWISLGIYILSAEEERINTDVMHIPPLTHTGN